MDYTRIKKALDKSRNATSFSVLDMSSLNGGAALKLIASFPVEPTADLAAAAIKEATNGHASLVPGSFARIKSSGAYHLARMAIGRETVRRPFSDAASMEKATATQYIDSASHIWSVVGIGADRQIVLQDQEDLAEILSARKATIGVPRQSLDTSTALGDFASVLTTKNKVVSGYVFASGDSVHVMDPALSSPIQLPVQNILRSVDPRHVNRKAAVNLAASLTARNTLDLTSLWAQLKQNWAHAPELVDELRQEVLEDGPVGG